MDSHHLASYRKQGEVSGDERLHALLLTKKIHLTFAESCTGGAAAARLIRLPGASHYLHCSFITYSESAKREFLDVQEKSLATAGAVSEQVALEMALGALKRAKKLLASGDSLIALAISGFAGPSGGTSTATVGTVCFAIVASLPAPNLSPNLFPNFSPNFSLAWRHHFQGDRGAIIDQAVSHLFSQLYNHLQTLETQLQI